MRTSRSRLQYCYVDECMLREHGFSCIAFTFSPIDLDRAVGDALRRAGLDPETQEFKSGTYMSRNPAMQQARDEILELAGRETRVAVCFASSPAQHLGKQALQALQSVLVRNGIMASRLTVYFDNGMFASRPDAARLIQLFRPLGTCLIHTEQDSKRVRGIQVSDAVAHSFAQILREDLTGCSKTIDIGGESTGYAPGTTAPLGWALLMGLRHALWIRPMVQNGNKYNAATDPVVLDPENDDPVAYGQNPTLLGWGVQVEPGVDRTIRSCVERTLGEIWLGCIH